MVTKLGRKLFLMILFVQIISINSIAFAESLKNKQKQDSGISNYVKSEFEKIFIDYENMFFTRNVLYLGGAIGISAILANTNGDESIREFYLNDIHQDNLDGFEEVSYQFGAHWTVLPVLGGAAVVGAIFDESPAGLILYSWGERSLRGFIVGAPLMWLLQEGIGSSRPNENPDQGSNWNPFNDNNGASGHAFVGAIPFLTAASMSENLLLKGAFFLVSFLSGWGRIYVDRHYFSQVFLGWSVGFLSVLGVSQTESKIMQLVPVVVQNGYGVGVSANF